MNANEDSKIDLLIEKVDRINRGLYGDAENKQPGLMQDHYAIKDKVEKLEDHRKKAIYYGSGLFVGLQVAWLLFKEKLGL
jgi:hypothetical protein